MSVRLQIDLPDAEYRALLKVAMDRKVQAHVLVEGLVRKALAPKAPPAPASPATNWYRPAHHDPILIRLHSDGWNDSQIGQQLGFTGTTIGKYRDRLGLPKNITTGRKPRSKGGEGNEAVSALRVAGPDPSDQLDGHTLG